MEAVRVGGPGGGGPCGGGPCGGGPRVGLVRGGGGPGWAKISRLFPFPTLFSFFEAFQVFFRGLVSVVWAEIKFLQLCLPLIHLSNCKFNTDGFTQFSNPNLLSLELFSTLSFRDLMITT